MKLIIDTNVVISAALRNRDPEVIMLFAAETHGVRWLASPAILAEYRSVLARPKFGLSPELLTRWNTIFDTRIELHDPVDALNEAPSFPRDQNDAVFLACAMSARADFLVTGDRDFEDPDIARRIGHTIIISVALFKRLVCDHFRDI